MNKFLIALVVALGVAPFGLAGAHQTRTYHYHVGEVQRVSGIVCTTKEEVTSILEAWKTDGYEAAHSRSMELANTTAKRPCVPFFRKYVYVEEIFDRVELIDKDGKSFIGLTVALKSNTSPTPVYAVVSEDIPGEDS